MTIVQWEHLVRDVIPRLEAEQQLRMAKAASVPHMTQEGRERILEDLTSTAIGTARQMVDAVTSQFNRFRGWLRGQGIDPESGIERKP